MKTIAIERDEPIIQELQAKLLAKILAGDKCGPFYATVVDSLPLTEDRRYSDFDIICLR